MKKLTLIIPCYNEADALPLFAAELNKVIVQLTNYNTEVLLINDGSSDQTLTVMKEICASDSHYKYISFSRNFGKEAAMYAGFCNSDGDYAAVMDADMQDPPELIPSILELQEKEQANVVYCVRKSREGEGLFKKVTAKAFYRMLNYMSDVNFPLDTGDFRLIDRKVMDQFDRFQERGKYIRGLISWVGFKQVPFYYEREARIAGETKYPFSKMWKFATTAMLYFSKKPLRLATSLGFIAVLVGIVLAVWFTLGKIYGFSNAETGWTSIMTSVIFFGGVQLLTVGVLGQYIGILFDEIKARPEYIIDEKKNF